VDAIEEFAGASPVVESGDGTNREIPVSPVTGLAAYPNPFNSGTVIRFEVGGSGLVKVDIFDLAGRMVWRSAEIQTAGGEVRVTWNARDTGGRNLPSGSYFLRVIHDGIPVAGDHITLIK